MRHAAVLVVWTWASACGDPAPRFSGPVVLGGRSVPAATLERGAKVYALRCASCHGPRGDGRGPSARTLAYPPADLTAGRYLRTTGGADRLPSDEELRARILRGIVDRGMPSFRYLPEDDLDAVVQFLKTLAPVWRQRPGPDAGTPSSPAGPK